MVLKLMVPRMDETLQCVFVEMVKYTKVSPEGWLSARVGK